jgi:hypothetical protein
MRRGLALSPFGSVTSSTPFTRRAEMVAVKVLGVGEREVAQVVADVVLGVDWRQTLVLRRHAASRCSTLSQPPRPDPG